jgi:hypothetical protein
MPVMVLAAMTLRADSNRRFKDWPSFELYRVSQQERKI